mgnify:CR=1 FL=1
MVCLTAAVALVAVAYGAYRLEFTRLQGETHRELSAIAGLKAAQIAQWRQEQLGRRRPPAPTGARGSGRAGFSGRYWTRSGRVTGQIM